ncbi:hypothetical protein ACP8HI_17340 [Paenibacillus sp. FA6]|uniref:hypothetical protein n=1 Tax=Paenibacillus sp. FA6 TaxID=3413029 RepID=UPI003F65DDAF
MNIHASGHSSLNQTDVGENVRGKYHSQGSLFRWTYPHNLTASRLDLLVLKMVGGVKDPVIK